MFSEIVTENLPTVERQVFTRRQHMPTRHRKGVHNTSQPSLPHKDKTPECAGEKRQLARESTIRLPADFPSEALQAGREWRDTAQILEETANPEC